MDPIYEAERLKRRKQKLRRLIDDRASSEGEKSAARVAMAAIDAKLKQEDPEPECPPAQVLDLSAGWYERRKVRQKEERSWRGKHMRWERRRLKAELCSLAKTALAHPEKVAREIVGIMTDDQISRLLEILRSAPKAQSG